MKLNFLTIVSFFIISRLGPCELPLSDQWLSHTHLSQISSLNHQSASTINLIGQQQQQQQHHQQQQTNQSQTKIMNVVASQVACPPATAPKKIRRKSDNKVSRTGKDCCDKVIENLF